MRITQKEKKELIIKKARNGKGIFVNKIFLLGDTLFQVTGTFVTCNEEDDMDEEARANTYRYDEDLYISPHNRIGDFLNHSCEPNSRVVKRNKKLFVQALSSIKKGEEILIDYSSIIADDDSWTMKCNCGSQKCRGKIKNFNSLPIKLKKLYIENSIVPDYILRISN